MERTIITKNNVTCIDERKNKRIKEIKSINFLPLLALGVRVKRRGGSLSKRVRTVIVQLLTTISQRYCSRRGR